MALSDPKREIINFTSGCTVQEIGQILQEVCNEWRTMAEHIDYGSGALSNFDAHCDIEVVISGKAGLLSPQYYAIQVYVVDEGTQRMVEIHALGNSGFSKAFYGTRGALKMSASIAKRDHVAQLLA